MDVGPSGRLGLSHLSHLSPQGWYSKEGRAAHPPAWIQCVTYFSRSDLSFPLMFMRSWTFDIQTQATPYWKTAMYTMKMFHTVSVQELLEWLLNDCFCCFSSDMTERCCLIKSNCSAERDGAALAWVEKYLRSVIRLLSVLSILSSWGNVLIDSSHVFEEFGEAQEGVPRWKDGSSWVWLYRRLIFRIDRDIMPGSLTAAVSWEYS